MKHCLKVCIEKLEVLNLLWLYEVAYKKFSKQDLNFEKHFCGKIEKKVLNH